MTNEDSERDPFDILAEELAERFRRGDRPTLEELTGKYPALAGQIRDLFPALMLLEKFGSAVEPTKPSPPVVAETKLPLRLGEYRLVREIGRGGMGVVYEAVQESLGRHVALKVLPFHGSLSPIYLERFRRESQAVAKLHHTNIVPVFGVGEHQGIHYYAMQFIHGQPLNTVLREVKKLRKEHRPVPPTVEANQVTGLAAQGLLTGHFSFHSPLAGDHTLEGPPDNPPGHLERSSAPTLGGSDLGPGIEGSGGGSQFASQTETQYFRSVAHVGVQVAEALAYAHHHGIIHRDIKPANLLLDTEGTVWVTDFGLAKAEGSDELTNTGDILGTLRFMAPERFKGVSEPGGDVYSLGVTLYELLTLQPAFADSDRFRLIGRVTQEEPLAPRRVDAHIPADLETIVLKAMAKDPDDRYPTAAALAEDLRNFLDDRPIRARSISTYERAWRWCRRNPLLAGATGLAMAALVAVALLSGGLAISRSRAAQRLRQEQEQTEAALREAERLSVGLTLDKSLVFCEQGNVGLGMLWLARTLELAHQGKAADLEIGIRLNLAGWGREFHPLKAILTHPDNVPAVAFSRDGRTILTGCWDGKARLWDSATGQKLGISFTQEGQIRAVAFSPGGQMILTGGGRADRGEAWLWDRATGKHLLDHPFTHLGQVRAVSFSPDGKIALTAGVDGTAQLWEVVTGRPVLAEPLRHPSQVLAAALSPDGKFVVTGCRDQVARLWDAATGKVLHRLEGHHGEVWSVAFRPDSRVVATGSLDRTARLWDVATGQPILANPLNHPGVVLVVAYSPDGRLVLTGGADGMARFWQADTGRQASNPLQCLNSVTALAFSPDGQGVLTGNTDGMARLWRILPPAVIVKEIPHPNIILGAAFSQDCRTVVTGDDGKTAQLWDVATGKPLLAEPLRHEDIVEAVAFSPDGRTVLTGSDDRTARFWEVATGKAEGGPLKHPAAVWAVAFHPNGRTALTGCSDGIVQIWDKATGKLLPVDPLPFLPARVLAFSPNGQTFVTGCREGEARLWDTTTGKPLHSPLHHQGGFWAVGFNSDGRTLLTGCGDGRAQLWELDTGRPLGPALQHQDTVDAVAFSPDGQLIMSGSADGTGRLWQTATGKPLGPPIRLFGWVLAVAFSPDGLTTLAVNGDAVASRAVPVALEGEPEKILLWAQVVSGMELDDDGGVRLLDSSTWQRRRQRLQELGGSPMNP